MSGAYQESSLTESLFPIFNFKNLNISIQVLKLPKNKRTMQESSFSKKSSILREKGTWLKN